jgi:methylphosphotriester-DNA--protein-cysteine methyltransferase
VKGSHEKWTNLPKSFIVGQFTQKYSLRLSNHPGMVGVVFWPAGMAYLLNISMPDLTDHRIELELVLGNHASLLEEQILECPSRTQKIEVLERYFLDRLFRPSPNRDIIDKAFSTILQHKGIISINRLVNESHLGVRQFRRRFIEKIGIPPKLYSRIKRFNYISTLAGGTECCLMDMVHQGGYYDQAHFIKDFCTFSGKKPTEFIKTRRDLAMLFSA